LDFVTLFTASRLLTYGFYEVIYNLKRLDVCKNNSVMPGEKPGEVFSPALFLILIITNIQQYEYNFIVWDYEAVLSGRRKDRRMEGKKEAEPSR
jgi:hypothetical protein